MRILQIGSDRSPNGILQQGSPAFKRQLAYAKQFGNLDIIAFSLKSDNFQTIDAGELRIFPTNAPSKLFYGVHAMRIAKTLPRPDVVSAQDPFEAGLAAYFITRHLNVPLHVQVHTDFLSRAYARHSLINRVRVHIAKYVLARADGIRVVSDRIARSLKTQNLKLKTVPAVLPIFTDLERIHSAPLDPDLAKRFIRFRTRLLVVARLEPEKNVALALKAFAKGAPPDACLIIVGNGSERAKLEALVAHHHAADRVFFEGTQDPVPYYKIADLLLVPSRYEGYGLVIIEALAAGVPVLSTDVGAARELGAIITSPSSFATDIKKWIDNGSRIGELKNYPYKHFDEYVQVYCAHITSCINKQK